MVGLIELHVKLEHDRSSCFLCKTCEVGIIHDLQGLGYLWWTNHLLVSIWSPGLPKYQELEIVFEEGFRCVE